MASNFNHNGDAAKDEMNKSHSQQTPFAVWDYANASRVNIEQTRKIENISSLQDHVQRTTAKERDRQHKVANNNEVTVKWIFLPYFMCVCVLPSKTAWILCATCNVWIMDMCLLASLVHSVRYIIDIIHLQIRTSICSTKIRECDADPAPSMLRELQYAAGCAICFANFIIIFVNYFSFLRKLNWEWNELKQHFENE